MKVKKIKLLLESLEAFNKLPDREVEVFEGPLQIGAQKILIVKPNKQPSFKTICDLITSIDANKIVEETDKIKLDFLFSSLWVMLKCR